MKLSKAELDRILDDVATNVTALLPLTKADPGAEASGEGTPPGSSTEESSTSSADDSAGSPPSDAPPAPPSEDSSGSESSGDAPPDMSGSSSDDSDSSSGSGSPGDVAMGAGGDPAAAGAPVDPAMDQPLTPEALQNEYAQLPPEELKMHLLACKAALLAQTPAVAPAAPPPPAPPAAPPAAPMDMGKSEGSGELESLKKTVQEQSAMLERFNALLPRLADSFKDILEGKRPLRKSLTGITYDRKPGSEDAPTVSRWAAAPRDQVIQKLTEITASDAIQKSDRNLINAYVAGSVKVDKILHILPSE